MYTNINSQLILTPTTTNLVSLTLTPSPIIPPLIHGSTLTSSQTSQTLPQSPWLSELLKGNHTEIHMHTVPVYMYIKTVRTKGFHVEIGMFATSLEKYHLVNVCAGEPKGGFIHGLYLLEHESELKQVHEYTWTIFDRELLLDRCLIDTHCTNWYNCSYIVNVHSVTR